MRVLFLTHRLPYPPNRGDRIRAFQMIRVLAKRAQVDVLSLVHSDEEKRDAETLRQYADRVATAMVPRMRNRMQAALALPGQTPLTHVLLDSPEIHGELERLVTTARPDVVLAYCSGMARFALAPPLSQIPFVLDLVDVDSEKWAALGETASWAMRVVYKREARLLRRFEAEASSKAVVTTVINDRESTLLRSINPNARIQVVSNGVDLSALRPAGDPSPSADVVFCGVFNYEPNEIGAIWLAKDVWPLVRQRRGDATLTFVGMDPTRRVRALAADASVRVTGAVPDVKPYLWKAAVSAAPLQIARGMQNKVLEAVAAGLPCVVTPQVLEGIPESVRPACVAAGSAQAFADALLQLLAATPQERRERASLARLDDWSSQSHLVPMVALLESAAASRPTSS
jgi:sugar transferase (PEP-CTERM/EpsH1 system associated)